MRYRRKRPQIVRAIQYHREDNIMAVQDFFDALGRIYPENIRQFRYQASLNEYAVVIQNHRGLYGLHVLKREEWIVREDDGPYKVVSNERFYQLYERVEDHEELR